MWSLATVKCTNDTPHVKEQPACTSFPEPLPLLISRALDCVAMQMRGEHPPPPSMNKMTPQTRASKKEKNATIPREVTQKITAEKVAPAAATAAAVATGTELAGHEQTTEAAWR